MHGAMAANSGKNLCRQLWSPADKNIFAVSKIFFWLWRFLDFQTSFVFVKKYICGSNSFIKICNSFFLDLISCLKIISKKTLRFEIFFSDLSFFRFEKSFEIVPYRLPYIILETTLRDPLISSRKQWSKAYYVESLTGSQTQTGSRHFLLAVLCIFVIKLTWYGSNWKPRIATLDR